MPSTISPADLESFSTHLAQSRRILTVLGAGLSASSGLPTFRGAGGLWRTYDATSLATPGAFRADPGLVWQFYSYRRHMALNARPNRAHFALAELARRKGVGCITLSQNVDGLSQRAGHPAAQLKLLHGNLFDVKCEDGACGYVRREDFTDPIIPELAIPEAGQGAGTTPLINGLDIANASVPLPSLPRSTLPHCPRCHVSLLRPGVVWFGEQLPSLVLSEIDTYFSKPETDSYNGTGTPCSTSKKIDLCLVIGTSSVVYPAAGYAQMARRLGARIAVVNLDRADAVDVHNEDNGRGGGDWFFQGDAAEVVPEILKSVVGETKLPDE